MLNIERKKNHRIIEWPGLKRTTMIIQSQPLCYVQDGQPPHQVAQSHIQPGLECLQGWGTHSLLGQPVQCVTTLCVKNFLLISNLKLSCLSLKPFPLEENAAILHSAVPEPRVLFLKQMANFWMWFVLIRSSEVLLHLKALNTFHRICKIFICLTKCSRGEKPWGIVSLL